MNKPEEDIRYRRKKRKKKKKIRRREERKERIAGERKRDEN